MDKPTCIVDGCDRPILIKVRQLCLMHNRRWQRHGDTTDHRRTRQFCIIDGCDLPVTGHGWCSKHYTRARRRGDPEVRLPGQVMDGKRICPACRVDVPLTAYGVNRNRPDGLTLYCLPCMVIRTAAYRVIHPQRMPDSAKTPTECAGCGTVFLANKKRHKYCSPICSAAYKNRDNWPHMNARRARLRQAFVEFFDRFEIFERDNWICQICGHPIDRVLKFPDPWSVSLDHIIPVAHGGKHERANAQTAHLHCNVVKSDSMT